MLAVLARLTLRKTKNKRSYFRGSLVRHTLEHGKSIRSNASIAAHPASRC
jgi:hypothetical protein